MKRTVAMDGEDRTDTYEQIAEVDVPVQLGPAIGKKKMRLNDSQAFIVFETEKTPESKFSSVPAKSPKNLATPWVTKKTKEIKDSLLRFHNEIIDFYNYVSPTQEQHEFRECAFAELKGIIDKAVPGAEVVVFGSFATKMYLPDGDIDVAVITDRLQTDSEIYDKIYKAVTHRREIYSEIQYIRKSKVPLIKLLHTETQIQFDISVNKADGLEQLVHVDRMNNIYPEFKYLVYVFKATLRIRGLSQTYSGGLGSFLLFCMLFIFLRQMQEKGKFYTLSESVLRFMEYYAIQNDWQRKTVYVLDGYCTQRQRESGTFSFISPQDGLHDLGKSAFKIRDVFKVFSNRFRLICSKNYRPGESILKELVNPSLGRFKYARD